VELIANTSGSGGAIAIFPLVAAVISLVFGVLLFRQFAERRRPYQALWAVAMLMFAAASAALFAGTLFGWSAGMYRAYWLFGAVLNVPFLAMGECYLLIKKRRVNTALLVLLLFASVVAAAIVAGADASPLALTRDLPRGKFVWGPGSLTLHIAQYYSIPTYVLLLAGTLWSAWKMRGAPPLRNRFYGTLAIACGATVVAAGAAFAATGVLIGLSLTLVAGVALMFWGFLLASRPGATAKPADTGTPVSSTN
jgi:MFS family permease